MKECWGGYRIRPGSAQVTLASVRLGLQSMGGSTVLALFLAFPYSVPMPARRGPYKGTHTMAKEFLVWGIPPKNMRKGDLALEELLCTEARSMDEAQRVARILEAEHGCTELRISVFEMGKDLPDFAGTVNV